MFRRGSCLITLTALTLVVGVRSAAAQPSATPPGPPPPSAAVAEGARPDPHWALGVGLGGMGITSSAASDSGASPSKTDLGQASVELRYRLAHRWQIALDAAYLEGQLPDGSPLTRRSGGVLLEGIFDLHRGPLWNWSIMLGLGGLHDAITAVKNGQDAVQSEFVESMARLGVGVERRFHHLALGAELYAIGLKRDDNKLDGPSFAGRDGPVPAKSSGGLLQLSVRYWF